MLCMVVVVAVFYYVWCILTIYIYCTLIQILCTLYIMHIHCVYYIYIYIYIYCTLLMYKVYMLSLLYKYS